MIVVDIVETVSDSIIRQKGMMQHTVLTIEVEAEVIAKLAKHVFMLRPQIHFF